MTSTNERGNYYKNRTKEMYEDLGYYVELTEFMTTRYIPGGRKVYAKRDVLGSDGVALNGVEIIFWNSKHALSEASRKNQIREAIKKYSQYPFPPSVKRQIVMWEPRKNPDIITL